MNKAKGSKIRGAHCHPSHQVGHCSVQNCILYILKTLNDGRLDIVIQPTTKNGRLLTMTY